MPKTPELPDGNLGSAEVASRYDVSAQRARQILYEVRDEGFLVETISRRLIIRESVLRAWEKARDTTGRPLPGVLPRGPGSMARPRRTAEVRKSARARLDK